MAIQYNEPTVTYNQTTVSYNGGTTQFSALGDTLGFTDLIDPTIVVAVTIVGSMGMTDQTDRITSASRAIEDNEGLTDSLDRLFTIHISITNSMGITDTITRTVQATGVSFAKLQEIFDPKPTLMTVEDLKTKLNQIGEL